MIKNSYSFLIALFMLMNVTVAKSAVQDDLYQAFLDNDAKKWESASLGFEKKADLSKTSDLLTLIHCYYGWTSVLVDKKQQKKVEENIRKAEKWIEQVLKKEPNNAEALNYKGVFIGYHITFNKLKAASLGKQSLGFIKKAYSLAPNNVQVLFDMGNAAYYTPKIFGGSKAEALGYYRKAISILEKQKNTDKNWVYVQLLMLEARCNELLDDLPAAKKGYEKTLKVEPNFKVVRDKFYPELKKKIK